LIHRPALCVLVAALGLGGAAGQEPGPEIPGRGVVRGRLVRGVDTPAPNETLLLVALGPAAPAGAHVPAWMTREPAVDKPQELYLETRDQRGGTEFTVLEPPPRAAATAAYGAFAFEGVPEGRYTILRSASAPGEARVDDDSQPLDGPAGFSVLFDLEAGQVLELGTLRFEVEIGYSDHRGHALAVSANGVVATSDYSAGEHPVGLWGAATGREIGSLSGHQKRVNALAFSPDGQLLASASDDGTLRLWSMAPPEILRVLTVGVVGKPGTGSPVKVTSVAFSPDGRLLAAGREDIERAAPHLWDLATGKARQLAPHAPERSSFFKMESLAFSPDGTLLAAGTTHGEVVVWDIASGRVRQAWNTGQEEVNALAFSPRGDRLATGGIPMDWGHGSSSVAPWAAFYALIKLWEPLTGTQLAVAKTDSYVSSLTFLDEGTRLLASLGPDGPHQVWAVPALILEGELGASGVATAVSSESGILVTLRNTALEMVDLGGWSGPATLRPVSVWGVGPKAPRPETAAAICEALKASSVKLPRLPPAPSARRLGPGTLLLLDATRGDGPRVSTPFDAPSDAAVGTVGCILERSVEVGEYQATGSVRRVKGFLTRWEVVLLTWPEGDLLLTAIFDGKPPPSEVLVPESTTSVQGPPPEMSEVLTWLAAPKVAVTVSPERVRGGESVQVGITLAAPGIAHPVLRSGDSAVLPIGEETIQVIDQGTRVVTASPVSGSARTVELSATLAGETDRIHLEVYPPGRR